MHPDAYYCADGDDFYKINNYRLMGCWMLDTGYWMLDAGCWMLDAGYWIL